MATTRPPCSEAADRPSPQPRPRSTREHRLRTYLRAFWERAYRENITGLSAMVAYNLLLAVFPFVLLVLFVFGQFLSDPEVENNILLDLRRLFPDVGQGTLSDVLDRIRANSTTIGIVAALGSLW
ncbi:MAG: YhjD/YihY/BrkB family envelope integrity protein, partial [Solirubrobacterales bacterium]